MLGLWNRTMLQESSWDITIWQHTFTNKQARLLNWNGNIGHIVFEHMACAAYWFPVRSALPRSWALMSLSVSLFPGQLWNLLLVEPGKSYHTSCPTATTKYFAKRLFFLSFSRLIMYSQWPTSHVFVRAVERFLISFWYQIVWWKPM